MQQYFVEQPLVLQKEQQLTNDQCHHILHVMRMRSGDVVRLADDSGAVMLAELRVQEGRVWALPTSIVPAAQEGAPITLITAMTMAFLINSELSAVSLVALVFL